MTKTDAPAYELVHVPAADIVLEDNIRTAADVDPEFLHAIKQHGVLLPTIGYRDASGAIVVRDGKMRVLAARACNHDVPVFITDRDTTDVKRLAEQIVANDRRTALTNQERLAAYRQLELAGLSEAAIAKQTGAKRAAVKTTLTVARSEAATAAVADAQLTFDDALVFAEFDGDPEAIARLQNALNDSWSGAFTHAAAALRQERDRAELSTKILGELAAEGKRVVTEGETYERLTSLTNDPISRAPITVEEHVDCPGHAWTVTRYFRTPEPEAACITPDAHVARYGHPAAAAANDVAPKTDAELAAEAEQLREERRTLRANNKAWDAAEDVRRAWLQTFLQRRTMPKDAPQFLAIALTRHGSTRYAHGNLWAHHLLGLTDDLWDSSKLGQWAADHPTKGLQISLAVVFTAFENDSSRNWWRYPSEHSHGYLRQLASWGYDLSPVERIAAGLPPLPTDEEPEG